MRALLRSLVILTGLSVGGSLAAEPNTVSNTSIILVSSSVSPTGGELSLVGRLHVQAYVQPSGDVGVKANLTQSAIGFDLAVPGLLPEAAAIKARIGQIKVELVLLEQLLSAATLELEEIRQADVFPNIPGLQFDADRARELRTTIAELRSRLEALQQELKELFEELETLLNEFRDSRPDLITLFTPLGADAVAGASCTDDLLCESVLSFELVTAGGEVVPFQIRLTLGFRADGTLVTADALACDVSCGSDSGSCSCS